MNIHRRRFTHLVACAAIAPSTSSALASPARHSQRQRVKAAALKRGDLVALFNPSGHADDALIQRATVNLETFGFRVMHAPHLRASRGNTAGTIGQRLSDLHALFERTEVRALWAARGGSGAAQLLPYIDYSLVSRNPKIVIGYSDLTALLLALHTKTGLVTFHGPVASSGFTPFTVAQLEATLIEGRSTHTMSTAPDHVDRAASEPHFVQRTLGAGAAEGTLMGGNLSVLTSLVGTPFLRKTPGALWFFEEIGEAPYRIDRLFTQLEHSGTLHKMAGAMLGVFVKCEPAANEESLSLSQALSDHFAARPIPSAYGLSFGHVASQWVLPIGVRARFNAEARTLTLLEPATGYSPTESV